MRLCVSLRLAGAVSAVLLCGCALAAPLVLTVSPAGRDSWSGKLAAPNAAHSDGPLASLSGARDAIRKLKAAGPLTQPIQVRVRGGVYRPSEMLTFEPRDSGTEACPISYVAAPKEKPVFSGGVPITGFKPWQGKIIVADLPATLRDVYFRSLFVDGERMIRARYPNRVPDDPYRRGFLYIRPSCFGEAIGATGSTVGDST